MKTSEKLLLSAVLLAGVLLALAGTIPGNAQTYTTYDPARRAVPASYETYKGAGAWDYGSATFAMMSSAKGKKLRITLSNVTTTDTYNVIVYNNGTSVYQVFHDAGRASSSEVAKAADWTGTRAARLDNLDASISTRLASSGYTAPPTAGQIDAQLSGTHGSGGWGSSGMVTVLPFQGAASYETVAQGKDVHVVRGDSVSIPYSIGKDITGWTVWFGAKANPSDSAYAIPLREATANVTDPAAGSGLINISAADTNVTSRRYYAELEIRNGSSVNTALRFFLWIDADVIR